MNGKGLNIAIKVQRANFEREFKLAAQTGEIVALVGPNGVGKSTILHAIAGLLPVASGSIVLDDLVFDDVVKDVYLSPNKRSVGFVFQDLLLFEHMSAQDNVEYGPRALGLPRDGAKVVATELLHGVGVPELAHKSVAKLSGGERQRVALARALAVRPKLLLLDEPLTAIDTDSKQSIIDLIRNRVILDGSIVIVVSHDENDVVTLSDRIISLC